MAEGVVVRALSARCRAEGANAVAPLLERPDDLA